MSSDRYGRIETSGKPCKKYRKEQKEEGTSACNCSMRHQRKRDGKMEWIYLGRSRVGARRQSEGVKVLRPDRTSARKKGCGHEW